MLLASLTKKKKKKKAVAAPVDEAAVEGEAKPAEEASPEVDGSKDAGTDYSYVELLDRMFKLLHKNNPALADRKRHTLPHPQLMRAGVRKTMWANFQQTCQIIHRSPEHLMSFVAAELGSEASLDGSQRLILKGRYVPKQAESLLKRYIIEYVTCHMCRNPDTSLTRDPVTRLYFLQCEACSSRRSVAPIKTGFHATMRADRKQAAAKKV